MMPAPMAGRKWQACRRTSEIPEVLLMAGAGVVVFNYMIIPLVGAGQLSRGGEQAFPSRNSSCW